MKKILSIVATWLVIVNVFGFFAMNRFNLVPDTAYKWITPQSFPVAQNWDFVGMHDRWDTYWYLDIVKNGYYVRTDNTLSNVAFFPLYPALIKIGGTLLGGNFVLAGWLFSMLFLFLSCVFFYKFLEEFHPEIEPEKPILFMLVFPTAFFFNIVYTESMFLFLTLATFLFAFRKNFWLAGMFAFFGGLTHSNGVFLALPILWKIWETYGWKGLFSPKVLPAAGAPLAMAGFFAYSAWKFHDLLLFFKLESAWGRSFKLNMDHFQFFSHPAITNFSLDAFFAILIIVAAVLVYRKLSPLYAIFMSLTVIAALSSGTLMSIGRYSLVLFPLFILLGKMKNNVFVMGWMFASTLFLALDIMLFVSNYWAG